jgi:hypothetical protein
MRICFPLFTADKPKPCHKRTALTSTEHPEIRRVDIVDHGIVVIVARGVDY